MKKLKQKVWDLVKIYTDADGAYKYSVSLVGSDIVIVPVLEDSFILSSSILSSMEELKKELSVFVDCSYLVGCRDGKPYIRFYIFGL